MNKERIYNIIQYALLTAGQEDDYYDQQLGPIHLIKYVYLADLAYAAYNDGKTFTGIQWQFYNFGPWSGDVYACIKPALEEIKAKKDLRESDYEGCDDYTRWSLADYDLFVEKGGSLPLTISGELQKRVHEFNKDTPRLLAYVYRTKPMLCAAPGEYLDFSVMKKEKTGKEAEDSKWTNLSPRNQKKFRNAMKDIQLKHKGQKRSQKENITSPAIENIYDDVFFEGLDWLDSLAGEPIPEGEFEAHFSPDVWKSKTRQGDFPD